MNVYDFLEDIKKTRLLIENKTSEVEQWQLSAEGTGTSGDGERVQTSKTSNQIETCIVNKVSAESQLELLKEKLNGMLAIIERLPADEYDLIHKVYVQDFTITQFARTKFRGKTWGSETHKAAKKHLQEILNEGKVEQYG